MIRHRSASGLHYTFGINAVVFGDSSLQRCVAVTVLSVNFELPEIHRQFAQRKCGHTARREIEPGAAPCLGPMHVVGVLMSHERARLNLAQK